MGGSKQSIEFCFGHGELRNSGALPAYLSIVRLYPAVYLHVGRRRLEEIM
jgi:hypothetical protein